MRKFIGLMTLAIIMSYCMCGCSENVEDQEDYQPSSEDSAKVVRSLKEEDTGFVALITDFSNIDDNSYNQASWEGVMAFGSESGYRKDFYRAAVEKSNEAMGNAMESAITAGADVLVCPGSAFKTVVYDKQTQHPEVEMILVDAQPCDANGKVSLQTNVYSMLYKEEQMGYLAGYAAVMEGYRKLGFVGGTNSLTVKKYGFGYVQGAEAAAKVLKLPQGSIHMRYGSAGGVVAANAITNKMNSWYATGTQVIFCCERGILQSVIQAAGTHVNRKIIGVDVNQAAESDHIIFSAIKGISTSVNMALTSYVENKAALSADKAGKTAYLGIEQDCVGLSAIEGSWRMTKFTIDNYNKFYLEIKAQTPVIKIDKLPALTCVKVIVG